ncbi:hypothetical protein ACLOJK_003251 [Asimina triloba]
MGKQVLLYLISKFTDTLKREEHSSIPHKAIFEEMKDDIEKIGNALSLSQDPAVLKEKENSFQDTLSKVDESLMECVAEAKRRKERGEEGNVCMRFSAQCSLRKRNLKKSLQQWKNEINGIRTDLERVNGIRTDLERVVVRQEEENPQEVTKIEQIEQSSSVFDKTKIYGWEDQVKAIYENLARSEEELNTVGIVGMFGAGKTKLAQKVFADEDVMDRFSLRLWVWVSEGCSRESLLRRMLDNLGVEEDEMNNALELAKENKLNAEGVLLFLLHLQLLDKRYLIVFDDLRKTDAWYCNLYAPAPDDDREWNRLAHGLPKGSGGAIIVTSRSEDDARKMVGRGYIHTPGPLSVENGWKLFKEAYVAAGKKESPELEKMKELITGKCAGLPLALEVAGRELPQQPEEKKEE